MSDQIELLGNSEIQHGKFNDRVFLMKLDPADLPGVVDELEQLARREHYSRICAKIRAQYQQPFLEAGFGVEARAEGLYNRNEAGVWLGRFLSPERAEVPREERISDVIHAAREKAAEPWQSALPEGLELRILDAEHAGDIVNVFREVFETYPFPIHEPRYIRQSMHHDVTYFGIFEDDRLMALASTEADRDGSHAEMMDFATLPELRGEGIASFLLGVMERHCRQQRIGTTFALARAPSFGMNIVFARANYRYAGRLINQANIAGRFESLNVWYKPL